MRRPSRDLKEAAASVAEEAAGINLPASAPYRDTRIDDQARSLPSFSRVVDGLERTDPANLYGPGGAERWALAWTYGSVREGERRSFDDFWREFARPDWRFSSIANLLNFESNADELRFPEGLVIRTRDRRALALMGWTERELESTVGQDWMEGTGAHGVFVMTASDSVLKAPENIALGNTGLETPRMFRLLQALRLHQPGEAGLGTIYTHRVEPFPVGIGGFSRSVRRSGYMFNSPLILDKSDRRLIAVRYRQLADFEMRHAKHLGHVAIALSRLTSAYDRAWLSGPDRLIDDAIALEALVGTSGPELTYTLATRVSGLLSANDAERVALFERVRSFYGTRSRLVHGEQLRSRHEADVQAEPELRDMVRRLLRGFLNLTASESFYPSKKFVDSLDIKLLDRLLRRRLQRAMRTGPASQVSALSGLTRTIPMWADQPPSSAIVTTGARGTHEQ